MPYPVHSPRFPCPTISNIHNHGSLHPVWTKSEAVGWMDQCNMMVVIHTDLYCAMTDLSMTHMPSLSDKLLANVLSSSDFDCSTIHMRQNNITFIHCQSTWLKSRTLEWPLWPFHMHRPMIMAHNLVTEIQKLVTGYKIDTPITCCGDKSSIMTYCVGSVRLTYKAIQDIHLNAFCVSGLGQENSCSRNSSWVYQASIS